MLHLGICDDNKEHQGQIYDLVSSAVFRYDEAEFVYYDSGLELIQAIEEDTFLCDLLFLDIHMPARDGLETAKYIRENRIDVDIIFVTVSSDHVFDGYTYQAFSYLLKPVNKLRLADEIGRYMMQRNQHPQCLHVSIHGHDEQILLNHIRYFATEGRKICGYGRKGAEISFYSRLDELEQTLSESGFIRCHQSYLVNQRYVQGHSRTKITVDGIVLPISRKYIESVRKYLKDEKEVVDDEQKQE